MPISIPPHKAHPWHGIPPGETAPQIVNAFIEFLPTDVMKYEIDKASGHLKIDRPQKYSNQSPALYGFIPQTYSGSGLGKLTSDRLGRPGIMGDGDPLDICVFSERPVQHSGILLSARPIGGLRLIDREEADDKIIAVLLNDGVYGSWSDIEDCSKNLLNRLQHYFLTYKQMPGESPRKVEIATTYGRDEAYAVISQCITDYQEAYGSKSGA